MDREDATALRVAVALLVLTREAARARRLIAASDGDVDHAANVYDVVAAARLAAAARAESQRRGRAWVNG